MCASTAYIEGIFYLLCFVFLVFFPPFFLPFSGSCGGSVPSVPSPRFLPFQFCQLGFRLLNHHIEFFLALLAGVCVDIAGVLFAVGPFGRIAALEEMVADLGDAAGAGLALAAYIGLESVILGFSVVAGAVFLPGSEVSSCGAALPIQRSMLAAAVSRISSVMWV